MEIVTETEAETEAAPGVMQGDVWSRCLTDVASKRRGGQSLGRETKRTPVRETTGRGSGGTAGEPQTHQDTEIQTE